MPSQDISTQLADALDNHQVTDGEGQIGEGQTSQEEAATPKEAPVEDTATAEKSADEESLPKRDESTENEPEMVETAADETGKRYVPEARFKEVYGKMKTYERQLKQKPSEVPVLPQASAPVNRQDALEIELLRSTLPQFNPEREGEYNRDIDELGFSIYEGSKNGKGQYTMTRLEAGRKAVAMAKKITSTLVSVKTEARSVKAQQSDQGITSRVTSREPAQADPSKMSLEEKEVWLKANGYW